MLKCITHQKQHQLTRAGPLREVGTSDHENTE